MIRGWLGIRSHLRCLPLPSTLPCSTRSRTQRRATSHDTPPNRRSCTGGDKGVSGEGGLGHVQSGLGVTSRRAVPGPSAVRSKARPGGVRAPASFYVLPVSGRACTREQNDCIPLYIVLVTCIHHVLPQVTCPWCICFAATFFMEESAFVHMHA